MLNTLWQNGIGVALIVISLAVSCSAQHEHGEESTTKAAPKVFLDKSPRVVEYQLGRLSNEDLLLVETRMDDVKYRPVFAAILTREGMPRGKRDQALQGLVEIGHTSALEELSNQLLTLKQKDDSYARVVKSLAEMLLELPSSELADQQKFIEPLMGSETQVASVGFAASVIAGGADQAWNRAKRLDGTSVTQGDAQEAFLEGIGLIPNVEIRNSMHQIAIESTGEDFPLAVRAAAIRALSTMKVAEERTFTRVAEFVSEDALREDAIRTLLGIAPTQRDPAISGQLVQWLVRYAEESNPESRTTEEFLDAMQLVDQLLSDLPSSESKLFRARLADTVVRVIRLRTVEEEMRYDTPYFAVEAGSDVQIVLVNEDIMPHNLVVTQPGALQEVAELGAEAGPNGGADGKQYVPASELVFVATDMVPAFEEYRLTFKAPSEPGEYPYVCTFPRHWMRMYGVMVVVEDLDAWQRNPVVPKDPVGSNRQFVKAWSIDDFSKDLNANLRGRTPAVGKRLFVEASCAQCHRAGELVTGNVGPDLGAVVRKWEGNLPRVLQEILDPSHHIEPKYIVNLILTDDGQTFTGLVVEETKESISLLENPEAKSPTIIELNTIQQRRKTSNSMMPKGLLDRFSRDEVLEILAYIQSVQIEK